MSAAGPQSYSKSVNTLDPEAEFDLVEASPKRRHATHAVTVNARRHHAVINGMRWWSRRRRQRSAFLAPINIHRKTLESCPVMKLVIAAALRYLGA